MGKSGLEVAGVGNSVWDPQEFGISQLGNVPRGSLLLGPPGRAAQVVHSTEQCLSATVGSKADLSVSTAHPSCHDSVAPRVDHQRVCYESGDLWERRAV